MIGKPLISLCSAPCLQYTIRELPHNLLVTIFIHSNQGDHDLEPAQHPTIPFPSFPRPEGKECFFMAFFSVIPNIPTGTAQKYKNR